MSAASTDTSIRTGRVTRTALYLVLLLFALFYLLPCHHGYQFDEAIGRNHRRQHDGAATGLVV